MNIYFAGLAKNCKNSLSKNLTFILDFIDKYSVNNNIHIYIFENDSIDGTKDFLKKVKKHKELSVFTEDGLSERIKNRIQRIAYCREFIIHHIIKKNDEEYIYIPLDFDLDLFTFETTESFFEKINLLHKKDTIDVLFPFSIPRYYDIHALRAGEWNKRDSWKVEKKISKYVPIGKFLLRYLLVYKKQKKIGSFSEQKIKVESAFGGIGIYKVSKYISRTLTYINDSFEEECEHVYFNKNFANKFIDLNWKIVSPTEHIEYHNNNFIGKFLYISNSLLNDIKNLYSFLIKK